MRNRRQIWLLGLLVIVAASPSVFAQTFQGFNLLNPKSRPVGIVDGPDGALWFTENNANKIGRAPIVNGSLGAITEFSLSTPNSQPFIIVDGPDGNLWFTEVANAAIGRISTGGLIQEFHLPAGPGSPNGIISGPDGNLWFTDYGANKIGQITTSGVITEFAIPTAGSGPDRLAIGPDGNLWFTESIGNQIGRITPSGSITEFLLPIAGSGPDDIIGNYDGNLWFTERTGDRIGVMDTNGVLLREYSVPNSHPASIRIGPDGNIWFTQELTNSIGWIVNSGVLSGALFEFIVTTTGSDPAALTIGSDGAFWFTEQDSGQIVQFQPRYAEQPFSLVAAVLPGSRSVQVGKVASAFATVINASSNDLYNCAINPVTFLPVPPSFQTTDPSTNAPMGTANAPVTIPAGQAQTFVISAAPNVAFSPEDYKLSFICDGAYAAPITLDVDTLLLAGSSVPVPDVIALSATASGDGILDIPVATRAGAFAVSTANIGSSGVITAAADTGSVIPGVSLSICQTDSSTGQCLTSAGPTATTTIGANATPTFSVFASTSGPIAFAPATSRIFVRFTDSSGAIRGLTSVAVRTQ